MDSLTHLVLGATLGEAMAGNKLKKRALILGAIAQSIPDIDIVSSIWLDPASSLLAHRGFTHSLLFVILITPLLVLIGKKWNPNAGMTTGAWFIFFAIQLCVHIFLDSFNAYGTGWLEPFSHERFSFNVLFVADPLYIIWLLLPAIILITYSGSRHWRNRWASFGLIMSSLYLVFAISNKLIIDSEVRKSLQQQSIYYDRYFTTPTSFNSLLWFVVVADQQGYHIGYRSVFDSKPVTEFHYCERNDPLLAPIHNKPDVQQLLRFSQGYYVISQSGNVLLFNDLRFGQLEGWKDPTMEFVFHYNLNKPDQDKMVIQRGRFSHWNQQLVSSMWERIKGN